ncbi:hypothetical protein [Mucisphaera sp.]|uniref:hypothetical protein n=1 Tax=Mucisphaera sp. TaxID=2913024 RepID=UPI003D0CF179
MTGVLAQGVDLGFMNNPATLSILMVGLVGMVFFVVWGLVQCARIKEEAALKARLIERGVPSEEIERILRATSKPNEP